MSTLKEHFKKAGQPKAFEALKLLQKAGYVVVEQDADIVQLTRTNHGYFPASVATVFLAGDKTGIVKFHNPDVEYSAEEYIQIQDDIRKHRASMGRFDTNFDNEIATTFDVLLEQGFFRSKNSDKWTVFERVSDDNSIESVSLWHSGGGKGLMTFSNHVDEVVQVTSIWDFNDEHRPGALQRGLNAIKRTLGLN